MNEIMPVKISVIIPTYNSAEYIAKAIQSVLDQDYGELEIIVVDDGSTDHTRRVIEKFGERVRYFCQQNSGSALARNLGISKALGKYIFFMDADDLLASDILKPCVELLEGESQYKAVYGRRSSFIDGKPIDATKSDRAALGGGNIFPMIVKGLTITPGQFIISRDVIDTIGDGFKEQIEAAEDWEFLLRLSHRHEFLFLDKVFIYKRIHNQMKSFYKKRPDLYNLRCEIIKKSFPDNANEIMRKHLTAPVIADWHRTFGFSYGDCGDRQTERKYLVKSFKTWPFQPKLWLWFFARIVPPGIKRQLKQDLAKLHKFAPAREKFREGLAMNKDMHVKISVVIPSYNTAEYLKETIQSVLDQDCVEIEVIVVDDGSTDDTRSIMKIFDNRVKYFYQQNKGESSARNLGLSQAHGEYVVFLDADDLLVKGMLNSCLQAVQANPQFKVIYGHRASFSGKHLEVPVKPGRSVFGSGNVFSMIVKGITLVPGQFLVAREVFEKIGGFDRSIKFGEDWDFLLRLSRNYEFLFVNEVFIHKRAHNKMQSFHKARPDLYTLRCGILKKSFPDNANEIMRKHLTAPVIADWHRTFGFSYGDCGDRQTERKYLVKSLKTWPFQPKLWLWFLLKMIPTNVKKQFRGSCSP